MAKAKQPVIRSKTYKGVRDYSVKAALKGGTIEVTVKSGQFAAAGSPLIIPASEWTERRTRNPMYDKWEYLDSRYNPQSSPLVNRLLDEVRKAADEVTGDQGVYEEPKPTGPKAPVGFRVFKHAPSTLAPWQSGIGPAATPLDVFYEMLQRGGFSLTPKDVDSFKLAGKMFYSVENHAVVVCLEHELSRDVLRAMSVLQPQWVLCLERGFAGDATLRTYADELFAGCGVKGFVTV